MPKVRLTLITNVAKPSPPVLQPSRCWHASPRDRLATSPWPEAIHSKSLCLHLNFHGEGQLQTKSLASASCIPPQTLAWSRSSLSAHRTSTRDRHECLTLVFPDLWLTENLRSLLPQLPNPTRSLVAKPFSPLFLLARPLTESDLAWTRTLLATPFCEAARPLLDTARLTDFLVRELLSSSSSPTPAPNLISRAERAAHDRVDRIKELLLKQLDENHELETLASSVGCSPHYLSRTFTQVTGTPLTLWLRRARIDRAADLIASGRCNVSEAALEVGYRSFSHFSRAFQQEKGVPPSKWITHLVQARPSPKKPTHPKS